MYSDRSIAVPPKDNLRSTFADTIQPRYHLSVLSCKKSERTTADPKGELTTSRPVNPGESRVETGAAGPTSVRDEHRLVTRQRLMRAALEVLGQKGYGGTTIEDVVATAGVARGTFYLHFENKVAVVRALTDDIAPGVASLYDELDDLLTAGSRSAIRGWMMRAFRWFDANATMVKAWREIMLSVPEFEVLPRFFLADQMPQYLAQWPESRRQVARLRVVLLVWQLAEAAYQFHVRQQEHLDVTDDLLIDTLTDLWIATLQAPSA